MLFVVLQRSNFFKAAANCLPKHYQRRKLKLPSPPAKGNQHPFSAGTDAVIFVVCSDIVRVSVK